MMVLDVAFEVHVAAYDLIFGDDKGYSSTSVKSRPRLYDALSGCFVFFHVDGDVMSINAVEQLKGFTAIGT